MPLDDYFESILRQPPGSDTFLTFIFLSRTIFKSLIHGGANMDTLVALGSTVAFIYSFAIMFVMSSYAKNNEWNKVMMYSMTMGCFMMLEFCVAKPPVAAVLME